MNPYLKERLHENTLFFRKRKEMVNFYIISCMLSTNLIKIITEMKFFMNIIFMAV